ncbi:hypothetical protein AJ80_04527 [Polytolypa hystricis UAMH7299]|uniref:Mediator of RNA polymerase II transcription subunit 21 n=1 Tax=Polytolypa hystricis (strain UAMH7299) TaxID=1447883 RepID=A0A2B7YB80_POLH7|nr:hypothetical protein AJ80_04527 [Polytolypa hystricis UAMH7299]
MADILTQLQTCLDQLATQFYATLCYLSAYHDHSAAIRPSNIPTAIPQLNKIPKNPSPATPAGAGGSATPGPASSGGGGGGAASPPQQQQPTTPAPESQHQQQQSPTDPAPDDPQTFAQRQRELARDLIIKEQQIEYLISVLPGIDSSEAEQEARIKALADELRVVEAQRRLKRKELRRLGERLDDVLGAVGRGVRC